MGQDTSSRRYYRYQFKQKPTSVLLMESVPDHHPDSMPGHKTKDFVTLSEMLRAHGIHTPEIYAFDHQNGLVLLEDFGDINFKMKSNTNQNECYRIATDVLLHIRNHIKVEELDLPDFFSSPVYHGKRRIIDWYFPALHKQKHPKSMIDSYLKVWNEIEQQLPECDMGFTHIDFHFENLMWIEHPNYLQQCGVLDFQGAMKGPTVYDVTNLLEDARVMVPEAIQTEMFDRYCEGMSAEERERTELWYRVIATQFHCRVLG
ncbi:MAG: phosphotransferase, partial [Rickettsiales bacterium]|nr:phosphotransferase [Rickettsiales bacterium]